LPNYHNQDNADHISSVDLVKLRRELVSRLRAQKLTVREITKRLEEGTPPMAVSMATVSRDLKILRREWVKRSHESAEFWISEELSDLEQVEREAWNQGDLDVVLRCKKRRAELLGLDKQADSRQLHVDLSKMSNEQLTRLAAGEDLLSVLSRPTLADDQVPE
jgi:transposase